MGIAELPPGQVDPADATDAAPVVLSADPDANTTWISWLRVVAIVGVVVIHSTASLASRAGDNPDALHQLARVLDLGFVFAVPVFVMISGALLLDPSRYRSTPDFLRKRAWRLIPAIVFWSLFYWWFLVAVLHRDIEPVQFGRLVLQGKLVPPLYFLWIVLGLALITPILIPWLAQAKRWHVLLVGGCAAALPVLTTATSQYRQASVMWIETPWTWWFFYLGLYLLGWGLRGVVIRWFWLTALAVLATAGLGWMIIWQYDNPTVPAWVQTVTPVSYYSLAVVSYSVLIYLVGQAVIRPGGWLGWLCRTRPARVARVLGDATLGVFGLHLAVLWCVNIVMFGVAGARAETIPQLLLMLALVVGITYGSVLILRRIPIVNRVV